MYNYITMEKEIIEQNKETFLSLVRDDIKREGIENLLTYLETTDFFTCPASAKYHLSEEGGLCAHSLNVYERLVRLCDAEFGEENYNRESVAIIALFHDLCKTNTYKVEMRNVKENGEWVQKPYYTTDDQLPYGHGEKSVYMLSGFIKLTREEAMAINWHMGGFDYRVKGGSNDYNKVYNQYPLALLTHIADLEATFLDESQAE